MSRKTAPLLLTDAELAEIVYDEPHGYSRILTDDTLRTFYFERLHQTALEQARESNRWKTLAVKIGPVCMLKGHDSKTVEWDEEDVLRRSKQTVTALVCERCGNTKRLRIVGRLSPRRQI